MLLLMILRISLFLFSLFGYRVVFKQLVKLNERVSWVASCALITLVLYFSAYLGQLYIVGISLFAIGCLLGAGYLVKQLKEKTLRPPTLNLLTIWLLFYFLLFAATLLTTHLEHYDNYSHWAIIVKFLYTEGRLPAAGDAIISFSSYPIGSSLFIYYATLIGGYSDSVMLFGQFVFIFSCIYAFFAVVKDESRALVITMLFSFIAVFNHFNIAIRMNNLLVDFLLPMLTLAGIAGLYRMQLKYRQMSVFLVLIAGSLSIVKNSALFFTAVLIVYYISRIIVNWKFYQKKGTVVSIALCSIASSFIPYILWSQHVKNNLESSKHEVNLAAYQQTFGEKDQAVIQQISDKFISTITNLGTPSTEGILLANLILVTTFIVIRFVLKRKSSVVRYWVIINGVTGIYYAGIYFMFLYSMPTEEALYLAGFERYAASIVILALGIVMMVLAREVDASFYEQDMTARNYRSFKSLTTKKWYQYATLFCLFFATLLLLSENNGMRYNQFHFADSTPAQFMKIGEEQMILNQTRYLVVSPDKNKLIVIQ